MKQGTLNRARMLEHRIQHIIEMLETCLNIVSNNPNMDICFSNNAANTNTQHFGFTLYSCMRCLIGQVAYNDWFLALYTVFFLSLPFLQLSWEYLTKMSLLDYVSLKRFTLLHSHCLIRTHDLC